MIRLRQIAILYLTGLSSWAYASSFARVDADVRLYDEQTAVLRAAINGRPVTPENPEWVRSKLAQMVELDQLVRTTVMNTAFVRHYNEQERTEFMFQMGPRWTAVDAGNTADLKWLLTLFPWFKISQFGAAADRDAFVLVQHADADQSLQREVLGVLETLWPKGETRPANYAYLFDRVASSPADVAKRKPQRYGTQGACTGPGTWEPFPVEDPPNLDPRRREMGLESEVDYVARFKDICHEDQRPRSYSMPSGPIVRSRYPFAWSFLSGTPIASKIFPTR